LVRADSGDLPSLFRLDGMQGVEDSQNSKAALGARLRVHSGIGLAVSAGRRCATGTAGTTTTATPSATCAARACGTRRAAVCVRYRGAIGGDRYLFTRLVVSLEVILVLEVIVAFENDGLLRLGLFDGGGGALGSWAAITVAVTIRTRAALTLAAGLGGAAAFAVASAT
jgi:hypothetical protein